MPCAFENPSSMEQGGWTLDEKWEVQWLKKRYIHQPNYPNFIQIGLTIGSKASRLGVETTMHIIIFNTFSSQIVGSISSSLDPDFMVLTPSISGPYTHY
jgi:hypothetical protein